MTNDLNDLNNSNEPGFSLASASHDQQLERADVDANSGGPLQEIIPLNLCDEELLAELASVPNQLAFKIGDVAQLVGVKTYVLRYWETEFEILNPKKSKNNQRMYTRRDVENVMLIKKLLYRDRFSIEGARSAMKQLRTQVKKERSLMTVQTRFDMAIEKVHELVQDIERVQALFR